MKRAAILTVCVVSALAAGLAWWFREPVLPGEPDYRRLDLPEFALWTRTGQVDARGHELQFSGSKAVIWLESARQLGPVVFQLRGGPSRVVVSSGGSRKQFDPPASGSGADLFLEWQPTHERQHRSRPGFFYRLSVWFPDRALGQNTPRLALLGTRELLDRDLFDVEWLGCGLPATAAAGDELPVLAHLRNASPFTWPDRGNARVRWVGRWPRGGDELRVDLAAPVESGAETAQWLRIPAPAETGRHLLELDLEYAPLTLFSDKGAATCTAEIALH